MWRNRKSEANLDDVVEVLEVTLMVISANVEEIVRLPEGGDDEEADA